MRNTTVYETCKCRAVLCHILSAVKRGSAIYLLLIAIWTTTISVLTLHGVGRMVDRLALSNTSIHEQQVYSRRLRLVSSTKSQTSDDSANVYFENRNTDKNTGKHAPSSSALVSSMFTSSISSKENITQILQRAGILHGNPSARAPFILYRAIGNDLPPRHAQGQTLSNVRFILENEPPYKQLDKRWYINRIIDDNELSAIVSLLASHNQTFTIEPFNTSVYANIDFNIHPPSAKPGTDMLRSSLFRNESDSINFTFQRSMMWDDIFLHQNQYIIRNNAARNSMLDLGLKAGAEYILPWDGNSFLNDAAWKNLSSVILNVTSSLSGKNIDMDVHVDTQSVILKRDNRSFSASLRYFYVPMARITNNSVVVDRFFTPSDMGEEPQLVFHRSALARFDETKQYGRRPKVDMLWRLGINGPWDQNAKIYTIPAWKIPSDLPNDTEVISAGWTARLSSGVTDLEGPRRALARGASRSVGVEHLAAKAWRRVALEIHNFTRSTQVLMYSTELLNSTQKHFESRGHSLFGSFSKDALQKSNNLDGKRVPTYDEQEGYVRAARFATVAVLKSSAKSELNQKDLSGIERAIKLVLQHNPTDAGRDIASENGNAVSTCSFLDAIRLAKSSNTLPSTLWDEVFVWVQAYSSAAEVGELQSVPVNASSADIPPFYATGPEGIRYELGAACCYTFLDDMAMLLRRTALARPRLWGFSTNVSSDPIRDLEGYNTSASIQDVIPCLLLARVSKNIGVNFWNYYGTDSTRSVEEASFYSQNQNLVGNKKAGQLTFLDQKAENVLLVRLILEALRNAETRYDKISRTSHSVNRYGAHDEENENKVFEILMYWIICETKNNVEHANVLINDVITRMKKLPDPDALQMDVRALPPLWYATIYNCEEPI